MVHFFRPKYGEEATKMSITKKCNCPLEKETCTRQLWDCLRMVDKSGRSIKFPVGKREEEHSSLDRMLRRINERKY